MALSNENFYSTETQPAANSTPESYINIKQTKNEKSKFIGISFLILNRGRERTFLKEGRSSEKSSADCKSELMMAQRFLLLVIYSVVFNLCGAFASTTDDHRRPMILPLHLSSPNARQYGRALDGRRLQRSEPNARMRLHDDLLANGFYSLINFPLIHFSALEFPIVLNSKLCQ